MNRIYFFFNNDEVLFSRDSNTIPRVAEKIFFSGTCYIVTEVLYVYGYAEHLEQEPIVNISLKAE